MTAIEPTNRAIGRRQRGAVSVETALVMPLIMIVIVGGVHFGMALVARHKLADAASYAARAAVIKREVTPDSIAAGIKDRMGEQTLCTSVRVTTREVTDDSVRRLDVTATCSVKTGLGGLLVGAFATSGDATSGQPYAVGPDEVTVKLSLPL